MTRKISNWTVIGSGPAGITAIGVLLENQASDVCWIDPEFGVGDLSQYPKIPGNTIISLLNDKYFAACHAFEYEKFRNPFDVLEFGGDKYCLMEQVISNFQTITAQFKEKVATIQDTVVEVKRQDDVWLIKTNSTTVFSRGIVLATGCVPVVPVFPFEISPNQVEISLKDALNKDALNSILGNASTAPKVAVFGSSHSAILALEYLTTTGIETLNVYKSSSEIVFAENGPEGYVNWYSGLKGAAAEWAQNNIVKAVHPKLTRVALNESEELVRNCTHVIYCCGFKQRPINVVGYDYPLRYDGSGKIGPNLYGVGIGFPPVETDILGKKEYSVGFVLFLDHLRSHLPKNIDK
ncbi:hypothetical protein HDV01_002150 [Terramyces sp. JEL0728]|nr:hypothetical protein HDV01_002150 [Terramyces sp. JEL0728]